MADPAYPIFVALDATALEGGQIFIGVAYDDPETAPAQVYWDEALTVPAAQPLRTSGGVIVRDGSPAQVYSSTLTYSIRVRDRSGAVVWYKPVAGGGLSASRLSFPVPTGPASEVPGPADNTYSDLAAFKASDVARKTASLVGIPGVVDGRFNWTPGNFTGQADDLNVVKADSTALSVGAWVRQRADGITFKASGSDSIVRTAQDKAREIVTPADFGAIGGFGSSGPAALGAFNATWQALSSARTSPIGLTGWGVGSMRIGKGRFPISDTLALPSAQGLRVTGQGRSASNIEWNSRDSRPAIRLGPSYDGVTLEHLILGNVSPLSVLPDVDQSVGIELYSLGGGGNLTLRHVEIGNFQTGIRLSYNLDGDKTLYEQCSIGNRYGWTNGNNTQAVCHHFLNCAFGSSLAHHYYTASGEVLITNASGDIFGCALKIGPNAVSLVAGRIVYNVCAYEMQGGGDRMVLDAREAVLTRDGGGSDVHVVYRDSRFDGGPAIDWSNRAVIKVGDAGQGSDTVTWAQHGGRIPPGRVELGSSQLGINNMRCLFEDAEMCPPPSQVQFQGNGNHALIEWKRNDSVSFDQYRGGQCFRGSIDAEKAYLWNHSGRSLVNSGVATTGYPVDTGSGPVTRYGGQFIIDGFPPKATVTGMAVFIDNEGSGTDTVVEWYADAAFTTRIGFKAIGVSATPRLYPVVMYDATKWQNPPTGAWVDGAVFVRITKPGTAQAGTRGKLLIYYSPYVGT